MKKSGLLILISILLFNISFIYAANETGIDKTYACLESKLSENCGGAANPAISQIGFNLLAISYNSNLQRDCKSLLLGKKKDNCWPEIENGACSIKSTAISILALEHIQEKTDSYVDWLITKRKLASGLTWYLEIDANNATECEINGKKFIIQDNKKITGQDPTGLAKAYNNYWFKVVDINRNYTVSCNKDFISVLLYQRTGSSTYYISSETHSAQASGKTEEKIKAYCFTASNDCDYEGSLWATLALAKTGEDITAYIPYLITMNDPITRKYLPSAFLYLLYSSVDDYYSELISKQQQGKFWDDSGNKFYDTALALLSLQKIDTQEITNTKEYFLNSLQNPDGCWPFYTSLLLYAGWPKESSIGPSTPERPTRANCEDPGFDHYCVSGGECKPNETLSNFYCSGLSDECCENKPQEYTCSEKLGKLCNVDELCIGSEVIASDTGGKVCCLGDCQKPLEKSECEKSSKTYICKSSCDKTTEEVKNYECNDKLACCGPKDQGSTKTNNYGWVVILLLIILIILIILAIYYRNQLKLWWFKRSSDLKTNKGPRPFNRPGFPPGAGAGALRPQISPPPQRPFMTGGQRPMFRPPLRRPSPVTNKDKDLEDTMKKLREMSQ